MRLLLLNLNEGHRRAAGRRPSAYIYNTTLAGRPVTDLFPPVASRAPNARGGRRACCLFSDYYYFLFRLLPEVADATRKRLPGSPALVSGADSIEPPLMFSNQFMRGSSRGVADQVQCVGVP